MVFPSSQNPKRNDLDLTSVHTSNLEKIKNTGFGIVYYLLKYHWISLSRGRDVFIAI
jgi:hypothetical protein